MASSAHEWTVADLLEEFGPVPASRIRQTPAPGVAGVQDVIDIRAREGRLYELIDGVLVEKVMGYYESVLALCLARVVANFVAERNLGVVAGADGTLKLFPGQVRIPDISFVSWDRLPGRHLPSDPIPQLSPDLVVEVISPGNTREEMDRKLREYFLAGVRLIWYVYPASHSVHVYTGLDMMTPLTGDAVLDGGDVLPGFQFSLQDLFAASQQDPSP